MAAMSNYLEGALLDHTLAGVTYVPPAARYVSLHTASPTDANDTTTEVTGGSYQRALASFGTSTGGTASNSNTLAFVEMPGVTVSHVAIYDAPTLGNLLYYGALGTVVAVTAGGTFVINAGGLSVSLD